MARLASGTPKPLANPHYGAILYKAFWKSASNSKVCHNQKALSLTLNSDNSCWNRNVEDLYEKMDDDSASGCMFWNDGL